MPDLRPTTTAMESSNYLTPRIGISGGGAAPSDALLGDDAASLTRRQQMTENLFKTNYGENTNETTVGRVAKYLGAGGIDLADMAVSALSPLERGDVWQGARDVGMTGIADFATRNRSGVELTSGIVGGLLTGYAADAYLIPAMGARLMASTYLSNTKLVQSGYQYLSRAKTLATSAAESAAINGEVASVFASGGARSLLIARVAEGAGKAVINEAAVAAVTHTNREVWSDDASTNLFMASLGIGIGGALGAVGARYEMRQIANSDEIMNLRAAASDPWGNVTVREVQPTAAEIKALAPNAKYKESVNSTAYALTARQEIPSTLPAKRQERIRNEATQAEAAMQDSNNKITQAGYEGAGGTRFSNQGSAEDRLAAKHLNEAQHDDPTLLVGVDSIGKGDLSSNVIKRKETIKALREADPYDVEALRKASELEGRESFGLVNKTLMPITKDLEDLGRYKPGSNQIKPVQGNVPNAFEYQVDLAGNRAIRIGPNGHLTGLNVDKFHTWRLSDQQAVYEGLSKQNTRLLANKQTFTLGKDPTWLQIDQGLNFLSRGGNLDFTTHTGLKTIDELQMMSLKKKAAAALGLSKRGKFDTWARAKLNLPLPGSLERIHDGTSVALTDLLNGVNKGSITTIQEAKEFRAKSLEMSNLRDGLKGKDPSLDGDMFNFNRDSDGNWRPILSVDASYNRVRPELRGTREQLVIDTAENKAARFRELQRGTFTRELTQTMMSDPNFHVSMELRGLADDQITGVGSDISQTLGSVLTRDMRYRDSKTMGGLSRALQRADRVKQAFTTRFMSQIFAGVQDRLASTGNRGSKLLVDQYMSFAGGWDLKKGFIPAGDGTFHVALENTTRNASRLGGEVADDAVLMSPLTGKPVVVDALAKEYIERFHIATKQLLQETNAVRLSRGMAPLKYKDHFVPPPDTKDKFMGFTIGPDGQVVPGKTVIADNLDDFTRLSDIQRGKMEAGERFFTKSQIESTADLWDRAEMNFIDPSFVGAPVKGQTGKIFGSTLNVNGLQDSMDWIGRRIDAIHKGTIRSMYDQQLAIAKQRAAAEGVLAGGEERSRRGIYDEYSALIEGRPLSAVKPTRINETLSSLDKPLQAVVDMGWPLVRVMGGNQVSQWIGDVAQRLGMKRVTGFKSFEDLSKQLGPHTPYANAMQWAESQLGAKPPPEVRAIASKINSLSASMLLRWFEIPNAAMNMLGIVTNMPSILRSVNTPLIGHMTASNGTKVGVVDSYKILSQGFKDMLSGARHADWEEMVRNGDTTQSVFEFHRMMGNMESKSSFMRVMGGDKSRTLVQGRMPKTKQEWADWVAHKGVDGLVSLATDTTESMSRAWAHHVGLRLADLNGIVGTTARHDFARDVANQAIANYNPMNKPELFQSSVGSMFGLFTSYMQQYNQRLFRWMETKDYASVGRQLAMQSTLFGVPSVPGYNMLDYLFTGEGSNPDATVTDAIYAKFGPKVGAIVAHGGVAELPRLFGLDNGVAIQTRADANIRSPSLDPTKLMAGLGTISGIANIFWDTGSQMIDPNSDVSVRSISESMARNFPNRTMKSWLSLAANDGMEVDASGQIVSDAKDTFEYGLRMVGLRSTRMQNEIEAYYANASQRRRMAGRMESLREDTRTKIRSGDQLDPMALFNKYVDNGGSPTHFTTWIQDIMRSQQDTRGMNDFVKALKSDSTQMEAWRYDIRQ